MKKIFVFLVSLFLSFGFADGYGRVNWSPMQTGELDLLSDGNFSIMDNRAIGCINAQGVHFFSFVYCTVPKDRFCVVPEAVVNYYAPVHKAKLEYFFKQKKIKSKHKTDVVIRDNIYDLSDLTFGQLIDEMSSVYEAITKPAEDGKIKFIVYEYNDDTDAYVYESEKGFVVVFVYRPPEV